MQISVYKILALGNGEEAEISIEISNGKETQYIKGKVSASLFSSLRLPAVLKNPIYLRCVCLFEKSTCTIYANQNYILIGINGGRKR